jgi:hypothetical protein
VWFVVGGNDKPENKKRNVSGFIKVGFESFPLKNTKNLVMKI